MCKESIQSEITHTHTKKRPPALICIEIRTRNIFFSNLALAGKLNLYVTVYKSWFISIIRVYMFSTTAHISYISFYKQNRTNQENGLLQNMNGCHAAKPSCSA